jgi:hypothetical protein
MVRYILRIDTITAAIVNCWTSIRGGCHCEERSDEAIQRPRLAMLDCFTYARNDGVSSWSDHALGSSMGISTAPSTICFLGPTPPARRSKSSPEDRTYETAATGPWSDVAARG